jgi:hypothetical protein
MSRLKKGKEKTLNKLAGFQKKSHIIDQDDKYDFPDLNDKKMSIKKEEVDKAKTPLTNEQYKETFVYETNKPAKLQKNINEFFPTLGNDNLKKNEAATKAEAIQNVGEIKEVKQDNSKPWWTKVEGKP